MLKPLNSNILVRLLPKETTTVSGIMLPDQDKKAQGVGLIAALPADAPPELELNLKVIFNAWNAAEIADDLVSLSIKDVVAYYEPAG